MFLSAIQPSSLLRAHGVPFQSAEHKQPHGHAISYKQVFATGAVMSTGGLAAFGFWSGLWLGIKTLCGF